MVHHLSHLLQYKLNIPTKERLEINLLHLYYTNNAYCRIKPYLRKERLEEIGNFIFFPRIK